MAKTKLLSVALTIEEEQEITLFVKQQMHSTGTIATKSSVVRDAIFKYIRNGKPDDEHVPAKEPTSDISPDPFADLIP